MSENTKEIMNKLGCKYPYYVEVYDAQTKEWRAEVRYYMKKQDVNNYPDNKSRKNFKYLGDED